MAGFAANQKIEYQGYFTIPDYRPEPSSLEEGDEEEDSPDIKIPGHYEVCYTCEGRGSMVNPSIDSNGITQSEMEELGDDFREDYAAGHFDVTCSECKGARVVLEPNRDNLTPEQAAVLEAWEVAVAEEGYEISMHNQGIQF